MLSQKMVKDDIIELWQRSSHVHLSTFFVVDGDIGIKAYTPISFTGGVFFVPGVFMDKEKV